MPRQTRRKSGTGIYHVMLRGINRQDIFEEEDYLHFLKRIDHRTVPWSIDYMLNDHVGVGLELNSLNSFFKKPEKVKIRDDERYGFSRLGLMAGVRYYF